jgi:small subunit ribosomal protein S11
MPEDNKKNEEKEKDTAEVDASLEVEKKMGEELVQDEKKQEESKEVKKRKQKKIKKQILRAKAKIKCSYNNTMIVIADMNGDVLAWSSSGLLGFKGAKKATPYAANQVVANVTEKVQKYGIRELEVYVRGVGSGREASIRALANNDFDLVLIKDITPIPHNGCRPKKPRRV